MYGGSGYTEIPTITISEPEESGFQAKAEAIIKDGSVSDIRVTQIGSGYKKSPAVIISKPNEEGGAIALATATSPENDVTNIINA